MRHGIHAHNPTSQAGTRRERGDGSWCQRSTVRAEGLRLEEVGVLTRLGRPNKPSSMGERLGSIIPLEELPTGTPILDMRALSQIKVVRKFPGAGRAAHGLIPFGWCVPLLAYGRLIIRHLLSKRSQNFSVIFLDIGIRFPYTFFAPIWSTFSHGKSHSPQAPISLLMDRGFVMSPHRLPDTLRLCDLFIQRLPLRIRDEAHPQASAYGQCMKRHGSA